MLQFVKNLIAAAILFISLITTLAFGYAITPSNVSAQNPTNKTIIKVADEGKKTRFILSHAFKLLIPKVKD